MFIFQKLVSDYFERIARWESAREKWVNEGSYRYHSEYERKHPHPNHVFKTAWQCFVVGVGFAILVMTIFTTVDSAFKADAKNKVEENKVIAGKDCKAFNNNDHVKISSGDYTEATGIIVGGCEKDKSYQVKIDKGTKADIQGDGLDAIDVSGKIIEISSKKDLVIIKLPEDKKE